MLVFEHELFSLPRVYVDVHPPIAKHAWSYGTWSLAVYTLRMLILQRFII